MGRRNGSQIWLKNGSSDIPIRAEDLDLSKYSQQAI